MTAFQLTVNERRFPVQFSRGEAYPGALSAGLGHLSSCEK
jgi:hypothetical protein